MYWYNEDLLRLEKEIKALEYKPKLIFYGSSSFTLWHELTTLFEEYDPLNLGFGGSTLAACAWYFERIFENIKDIEAIIIYAGDNDLGDGRHPEEVILFLENLLAKIRGKYGDIQCTWISIKLSLNRLHLSESIRFTNKKIQEYETKDLNFHFIDIYNPMLNEKGKPKVEYFDEDGLHLNQEGYNLWFEVLKKHPEIFPQKSYKKQIKDIIIN